MTKVLFVCYGNICRSPMAEFMFKKFVEEKGDTANFYIESAATSTEEIGSPVHRGTRKILDRLNVDYSKKTARQITQADYLNFDYIIGMDEYNRRALNRFYNNDPKGKISLILDYTGERREVADPWYTGNFETTYQDIKEGIEAFYAYLKNERK